MDILSMHPKYWRGDTRRKIGLAKYLYKKYWLMLQLKLPNEAHKYRQIAKEKGLEHIFKKGKLNGYYL